MANVKLVNDKCDRSMTNVIPSMTNVIPSMTNVIGQWQMWFGQWQMWLVNDKCDLDNDKCDWSMTNVIQSMTNVTGQWQMWLGQWQMWQVTCVIDRVYTIRPFFILGKSLFQNFTMLSTSDAAMQAVYLIQYIVLGLLYKTDSRYNVSQTKKLVFFEMCNVHLSLKLLWLIISQTWPRLTERKLSVDIYNIMINWQII